MKGIKYFSFFFMILFSSCNLKIQKELPFCYEIINSNMKQSNYNEVINFREENK